MNSKITTKKLAINFERRKAVFLGTQNGICRKGGTSPAGNALSVFPFISLTDPTLSNSFAGVQHTTMDHFTPRLLWNTWAEISLEALRLCF